MLLHHQVILGIQYKITEMTGMIESSLNISGDRIFIAVSHGWIGALDSVPMVPYTNRKYVYNHNGKDWIFDSPFRFNERSEYPFPNPGDGLLARLERLKQ